MPRPVLTKIVLHKIIVRILAWGSDLPSFSFSSCLGCALDYSGCLKHNVGGLLYFAENLIDYEKRSVHPVTIHWVQSL